MPAILRIFVYQLYALPTDCGSYAGIGVIVGQGGHLRQHEDLEHDEVSTLPVWQWPVAQSRPLYCPTLLGSFGLIEADGKSW